MASILKKIFGKNVISVSVFSEETREGINKAYIPKFLYKPPFGYPRYTNVPYIRYLAQSPYVEMCISTIIDEICAIEWDIIPTDGMEEQADESELAHIKNFFENPNTNNETFDDVFVKMPVRDILEINSGILNKVYNLREDIVEIVARDGATFTKNPDIHGMFTDRDDILLPKQIVVNPNEVTNPFQQIAQFVAREQAAYFQYGWIAGPVPVPFGRKEIIWLEKMKRTDEHYGYSPVQILAKNLQTLIYAVENDLDYFNDNNVPKGIIGLEESDSGEIEAFKEQWYEQQRKKDEFGNWRKLMHKVPIVNKIPKFERIEFTSNELQIIEKQKWWTKMVWASFGVTPTELGYTEDAKGSANQIVQSKVFRKKAINPMLRLLEKRYNAEIVSEFGYIGFIETEKGKKIEVPKYKFVFKVFDIDEEKNKYELYKLQTESGLKTVNEVRKEEGLEEVEWGDKPPKDWQTSENEFNFGGGFPGENPEEKPFNEREEDALGPGGHDPDGTGPHDRGEGPGQGKQDGSGLNKEKKSLEFKYKYIKRTGSAGHYKYWYRNPQTGKLESRAKPKLTENLNEYAQEKYNELSKADRAVIEHNIYLTKKGKDTKNEFYNGSYWHKSRRVIHKKVIKDYSQQAVKALSKSGKSKVVFMAGLPASGKTYATQNYFEKVKGSDGKLMRDKKGNNYLLLNTDDIKKYLPEYNNGKGACLVHGESSHINSKLIESCTSLGVNIIVDGTLANVDKANKQIDNFKEKGYDVKLIEVSVPPKMSIDRAGSRYKEEGRFVPYDLIIDYEPKIKKSVNEIKNKVDSFINIDNTGNTPKIIEKRGVI